MINIIITNLDYYYYILGTLSLDCLQNRLYLGYRYNTPRYQVQFLHQLSRIQQGCKIGVYVHGRSNRRVNRGG